MAPQFIYITGPSGPVSVYRDTQINTTNGTTGAVSVSIGPADSGRVVYVVAYALRTSGNQTADGSATFSSGTPSLLTSLRFGLYTYSVYRVTGCTGTSLTVTISGDGTTQAQFFAHVWTTTTTVTVLDTVTLAATNQDPAVWSDVQVVPGGFVLLAYARGNTAAETSETYSGADAMTKHYGGTTESTIRTYAASVSRTTETASGNDFSFDYAAGALTFGLAMSFTP